jgi:beta-lactamase class A
MALMTRRTALVGALLTGPALLAPPAVANAAADAEARLADLERTNGGRLGVAILDLATGRQIGRRADERFAMCSTFKLLASALVLSRVDRGEEHLDRLIPFAKENVVPYSPVTEKHAGNGGMSVAQICEAALTHSDNTAGNLMLASFGGPGALTAYARSLGDETTRLDRIETDLNEATPGDPRDTTTPAAMVATMRKIMFGDALSETSRAQLTTWLVANTTGGKRLRAGLPEDWRIGDKTGTSGNGATNDLAIVWPPARRPIIVAAYFAESPAPADQREAVLAEVGRIVAGL